MSHETPAAFSLSISPSCNTRSKALLLSQKTTDTSLPTSTASVNIWHKYTSGLTIESPGMKPDCKDDTCNMLFFGGDYRNI